MMPMVETAAQAQQIASWCRYRGAATKSLWLSLLRLLLRRPLRLLRLRLLFLLPLLLSLNFWQGYRSAAYHIA
jgi:hypothetical protein